MSRAMKDSGIPWIGDIPKDWNVSLIASCIKEVDCRNTDGKEDNALQFKMGTIISKRNGDSKYNPETLEAYNIVKVGDIIINGLNLSFDLISQRVGLVKENGVITSTYIAVRPTINISNVFLTYLFKAYDNCKAFHSMGRGLRQTLSYGELRKYYVVLPLKEEQQRIAEFLDRKSGEIDEAIALQEEFIEELKSYKQSVITEAVTRGLNPNVKLKDSGIDWIGKIPQGWEISRLKQLTSKIGSGSTPTGGASVYVSEGVKFIRSQNVYNYGFILDDIAYITEQINNQMKGTQVAVGDILFNITGGSIGRCYIVDETLGKANVNQHVSIIRPSLIYGKYLMYYLQSKAGQEQVSILQTGGNREGLAASAFGELWVIVPTPTEQRQIADYLDTKCTEIDSLIAIKQQKIEELKDYKKSIIYEYITGKKEAYV